MRLLTGILLGFLLSAALAFAAFTPAGVSHFHLVAVTETSSPTADAKDRPLLEFTNAEGQLLVLTFKDTTQALVIVTASGGVAPTTSTTAAPTTTTVTTTTVTTTTT